MKTLSGLGTFPVIAMVLVAVSGCADGPPPEGTAEAMVLNASGQIELEHVTFLEAVGRKDQKLVLVDFWAPWCGPCLKLTPAIEGIKQKWGDKLHVIKVNVDDNNAIAAHLNIHSIPDVRIYRNGTQVGEFAGVMPQDEIDAMLRSLQ